MAGLEQVKQDFTFENELHRMFNEVLDFWKEYMWQYE